MTSLEVRNLIVRLRNEDKHSIGEISNIVKTSKNDFHDILNKLEESGSYEAKNPPGRPRKTTSKDDRNVRLQAKKNKFSTATDISRKVKDILCIDVSRHTVSQCLMA